jgi:hypothetical protein
MKPTDKAPKAKQAVAETSKPGPKEQKDREKFERARKALYEYWKSV